MATALASNSLTYDKAVIKDRLYVIEKELGVELSTEQRAIIQCPSRDILVAGGERGGKSEITADFAFGTLFTIGAKLVWLYGAEYDETSQEWYYCLRNANDLGILKGRPTKNHNPGKMELTIGCTIKTVSGHDLTDIGREAPDIICVCEASKISQMAFHRLKARLAERRGYLFMSGTFEGSIGWYPELFELWQIPGAEGVSFSLPTWSNLKIFPGGREDPEILRQEASMPQETFMERFAGVPCPPTGLVFKDFKVTHHVADIQVNPDYPVYLWVDPGYATAYAVLAVQIINDRIYVIDEIYVRGRTTREVIQMCKLTPSARDFALGQSHLNHCDPWWHLVNPVGVMDVAGSQHQGNESVAEVWGSTAPDGAGITMQMQKVPIQAGTDRYRDMLVVNPLLGRASVVINSRCRGLISEHGGCPNPITGNRDIYAYPVKDGVVISEVPEDKNNHAIKAMIYGIIDRFGYATKLKQKRRSMSYT